MSTAVTIAADFCAAILIMEFVLHGIAMLTGMDGAVKPLTDHLGFPPGRPLGIAIGLLDAAATAALIIGFGSHGAGAAGAAYAVLYFGVMMALRFRRKLGTLLQPPDFPLFLTLGVILLVIRLAQMA
ncbi:MAG TPA: hypothetical protein VGX23_18370 [Actinocrinis sp.]|nr:hypothetical protein [Actinocrinis sp.]